MRRTKIVCTVGPVTADYEALRRLYHAGMNVLRFNMSHGDEKFYRRVVGYLKKLRREEGAQVGILWDLQGPEIRTGDVAEPYELKKDETVCLTSRPSHETDKGVISVTYDRFAESLSAKDIVLLDNGSIKLRVISVQGTEVRCRVLSKGKVKSRMHVNLQGKPVKLPSLSEKDLRDLRLGVKLGVDWVALSYVRSVKDIKDLKVQLQKLKSSAGVMAKIETPQAVEQFEKILKESDAIMVARGDLGAEMPFEEVPHLQNEMVQACRLAGKPVVIATHMLESMITLPTPTRAEATDVAHAVISGVDATMLSGETAVGDHAVESVQAMAKIIESTEQTIYFDDDLSAHDAVGDKEEILLSAATLANRVEAKALMVFTISGESARMLVRNRPNAVVLSFVKDQALARRLSLLWGVKPVMMKFTRYPEKTLAEAMKLSVKEKLLRKGSKVVIVSDSLLSGKQRVASVFLTKVA